MNATKENPSEVRETRTLDCESVNQKQWLSILELSVYLGLRPSTLYSFVNERRIPVYRIPGSSSLRFKKSEIDAWVESGKIETASEYFKRSHKKKGNGNGTTTQEKGQGQPLGA